MPSNSSDQPAWTVIIPVKQTTLAKSRLTNLKPASRQQLARAFALDTAVAALGCHQVREVVVVTNDPGTSELERLGVRVLADGPDTGLNEALVYAAELLRAADPDAHIAAISADLPALRAQDLSLAFEAGSVASRWFVADSQGVGTTMLAATPDAAWVPSFGPQSRAAHRALGFLEIEFARLERLRRDVDIEADLRDAVRLGVGRHTLAVLAAGVA